MFYFQLYKFMVNGNIFTNLKAEACDDVLVKIQTSTLCNNPLTDTHAVTKEENFCTTAH